MTSKQRVFVCIKNNVPDGHVLRHALKTEVMELGRDNFEQIVNSNLDCDTIVLGLIWRSSENDYRVPFLDHIEESSNNSKKQSRKFIPGYLFHLLHTAHIEKGVDIVLDLISCNLNSEEFRREIDHLEEQNEWLNIRYSVDNTGNNKGNWILESDDIDIKDIYFNDDISNYHHILDTQYLVAEDRLVDEISYDPLTKTYKLTRDFHSYNYQGSTWNPANGDFILCLKEGQTFDGNGFDIILSGTRLEQSLFNVSNITNEQDTPVIKNVRISNPEKFDIGDFCLNIGCLLPKDVRFIKIDNCVIKDVKKIDVNSSGICGRGVGYNGGRVIITNCKVYAETIRGESGGICSAYAGESNGHTTIENCEVFVGSIDGWSGGICSSYAGSFEGYAEIISCHVSVDGDINNTSGGICGYIAGYGSGTLVIRDSNVVIRGNLSTDSSGVISEYSGQNGSSISIANVKVHICGDIGDLDTEGSNGVCGFSSSTGEDGLISILDTDLFFYGKLIGEKAQLICPDIDGAKLVLRDIYINAYDRKIDMRNMKLPNTTLIDQISSLMSANNMKRYVIDNGFLQRLVGSVVIDDKSNVVVNGIDVTLLN